MKRPALAFAALFVSGGAAAEPEGLDAALAQLEREGKFSGAVVIRDHRGVRFSRGYGKADRFENRSFTPRTPVDSGSLAKPVTAGIILSLARSGAIDLGAPVRHYVRDYPDPETTVRHLLAHSAGVAIEESEKGLAGKTNDDLLRAVRGNQAERLFPAGTDFSYCNLCTVVLAMIAEKVTGRDYLTLARSLVALPTTVTLRPPRLSDWKGRAIGHRLADGKVERFDSFEGEAFYGPANLSINADELALWGSQWSAEKLATIRDIATEPARISGKASGLSWGNWYCARSRERCHYLGHHQGFHHMLYWDRGRRLSVAMVSNNTLAPGLQQRLQRALVAFAEGRVAVAQRELAAQSPQRGAASGTYRLGERTIELEEPATAVMRVGFDGLHYDAFPVSEHLRYVPGLDAYISGAGAGRLNWLTLYDDVTAAPMPRR